MDYNILIKLCQLFAKGQFLFNYDYGDNIYSNMDKYKSIMDFRKKRRQARKEKLKKLIAK